MICNNEYKFQEIFELILLIMKKIIFGVLALLFIGGAIGYYLYTKPSEFVSDGTPDFTMNLSEVIKESNSLDAPKFSAKYTGKSIEFDAEIESIAENGGSKTLVLKSGVEDFVINANFHESNLEVLGKVVAGDKVKLQCECSGVTKPESEDDLLSEVVLNFTRCDLKK